MKYIQNQCGYAMIEALIAITTLAIIMTLALLNFNNVFKTVYVNSEMLSLYGDMRFVQAANRICFYGRSDLFAWETLSESTKYFLISSGHSKKRYSLKLSSDELKKHNLSKNYSFKTKLAIFATRDGKIKNTSVDNNSAFTLRMTKDETTFNPVIVVNSVGRMFLKRE